MLMIFILSFFFFFLNGSQKIVLGHLFNQLAVCQNESPTQRPSSEHCGALCDGLGTVVFFFKKEDEPKSVTCAGEQRTETVDGEKSFTLL